MQGKKIALLGATGFLGNQMLVDLVDGGFRVTVVLRRTINNAVPIHTRVVSLQEFLTCNEEFDYIVNCAGYYSKSTRFLDVYKIRKSNYILIKKLIEFRKRNGGSLITFGSYFEKMPAWKKTPATNYTKYKLKSKKKLIISAEDVSSPIFYIYLFDTYGKEDSRNKVLTYIISEFKAGRIPVLTTPLESINWSHKSDISASIITLINNSNQYLSYRLHEFQIRSSDEFRLVDFVNMISSKVALNKNIFNKDSNSNSLFDCATNLPYFIATNNVIDFTLNSIDKNETLK